MRNGVASGVVSALALCVAATGWSGETTYRKHVKPLFDAKCAACHGGKAAPELGDFKEAKAAWMAKGQGMRMDTYSHLIFYVAWPDTGALMRRLDDGKSTRSGKPGNMYQHLGTTDQERQKGLKVFKAWVGNWTLKRRRDATKEDLEGIQVKY